VPSPGSTRHLLTALVGIVLIGLVFLLPDLSRRPPTEADVVQAYRGRIESIEEPPADRDPETPPVPIARVQLLDGPRAGETLDAYLSGPGGSQSIAGYAPGEEVVVTITASPLGQGPFVAVSDRWRIPSVGLLALLFAAAVVVIGGWHGVRALVALGLTIAVLLKVLLPLVISGIAPVPLAVIGASVVTVVTILLTEGWKRSSLAAILGTTGSLAVTGLLAGAATAVMGFTYTAGSDLAFLSTAGGEGLNLRGILLAAFILGAVGVLDDVTVTQAVLVEELADKGGLRGSSLIASGMGIGRSHIAATVNTLFLAYVGAGLPLLVVLLVSRQPLALVLNDETITTEIVRTLVGSLGIVAAVPLTTFIAASLIRDRTARGWNGRSNDGAMRIAAAGAVIVALLVATAVLPLASGSRPPLAPDVFDPATLPSASALSAQPSADADASPSGGPAIVAVDEPVPLVRDGRAVATVTVTSVAVDAPDAPAIDATISVGVRYEATAPFALATGSWRLLLADGTDVALVPAANSAAIPRELAPGDNLDVALEARYAASEESPFIVYVDSATSAIVFGVPSD
jgi:uncharacterized membrane protein